MSYGNVTLNTASTLILDANSLRQSVIIKNISSQTIYIGSNSSVTTLNGLDVSSLGNLTEDAGAHNIYYGTYYGIVSTGTANVRYWERVK